MREAFNQTQWIHEFAAGLAQTLYYRVQIGLPKADIAVEDFNDIGEELVDLDVPKQKTTS